MAKTGKQLKGGAPGRAGPAGGQQGRQQGPVQSTGPRGRLNTQRGGQAGFDSAPPAIEGSGLPNPRPVDYDSRAGAPSGSAKGYYLSPVNELRERQNQLLDRGDAGGAVDPGGVSFPGFTDGKRK